MEKYFDDFLGWTYDADVLYHTDYMKDDTASQHDFAVMQARFLVEREDQRSRLRKKANISHARNFISFNPKKLEHHSNKYNYLTNEAEHKVNKRADRLAFAKVKPACEALALAGNLKAISMYLTHTESAARNPVIVAMAERILDKDIKTPEEWEVCASLYYFSVNKRRFDDISDMVCEMKDLYQCNIYYYDEDEEKEYEDSFRAILALSREAHDSLYGKCIEKALLGYYARYFSAEVPEIKYLDDYLFIQTETNCLFSNLEIFSEYSEGRKIDTRQFAAIMKKSDAKDARLWKKSDRLISNKIKMPLKDSIAILNQQLLSLSCTEIANRLAKAKYLTLYSNDSKERKEGYKQMLLVSKKNYLSPELANLNQESPFSAIMGLFDPLKQEQEI